MNLYSVDPPKPAVGTSPVPQSLPIHLCRPALPCFLKAESKPLNHFLLISRRLARTRARRFAGESSGNSRAGCPPFAIPSGERPISLPVAEHASAVGSARSQAASVATPRNAAIATAADCEDRGRATQQDCVEGSANGAVTLDGAAELKAFRWTRRP
jgi:hypothetical protein